MLHMTFYPIQPWMASPNETRFWDVQADICAMQFSMSIEFLIPEYTKKTLKRQLQGEKQQDYSKATFFSSFAL